MRWSTLWATAWVCCCLHCNSFGDPPNNQNSADSAVSDSDATTNDALNPDGSIVTDGSITPPPCVVYTTGNEIQLNSTTTGDQDDAVVAARDSEFVGIWVDRAGLDGDGGGVFGQRFSKTGSKIGNEFRVNDYTAGNQYAVSAAYNGSLGFVTVMKGSLFTGDNNDAAVAQVFNGSGVRQDEFRLNQVTNDVQGDPAVAVLGSRIVFTWYSYGQDGDQRGIYSRITDADGSTLVGEFQVNTYTQNTQNIPAIASLGTDRYIVTWHSNEQDGSGYGVYGQVISDNGTNIGSEFRAAQTTAGNQDFSSVIGLDNGHFVVAWQSGTDPNLDVFVRVFDATGQATSDEVRVNETTAGYQSLSPLRGGGRLASLGNARFVVVWESLDDSGLGIYYRIFEASDSSSVSAQSDETLVNQTTTQDQSRPKVAAFDDGSFVVSWQSDGQDGDLYGVFARVFYAESCN